MVFGNKALRVVHFSVIAEGLLEMGYIVRDSVEYIDFCRIGRQGLYADGGK